jgi:putative salt-induced outer membrane protein YdiY
MPSSVVLSCFAVSLFTTPIAVAQAQQPPAPMSVYSGSFGGGLALTSGNTDTKNFNITFNLVRDPKTKNVFKVDALYLRASQNDVLTLHRSSLKLRDEYSLTNRVFLFAEFGYLRDEFKDIQYLLSPIGGIGYKLINTDRTLLTVSGGAGGYFEKNSYVPVKKSGSLNAGQDFSQKLSSTSTLTENVSTLWKTNDFGDSLTNFRVGVTSTLYKNLQLKVEFLDSYKTKPPNPTIKKNDTAFLTTFLLKYGTQ